MVTQKSNYFTHYACGLFIQGCPISNIWCVVAAICQIFVVKGRLLVALVSS